MLRYIQNIGEYFPSNYFDDEFAGKVIRKSEMQKEERKSIESKFRRLKDAYFKYKRQCMDNLRTKDLILETHRFNTRLLEVLGFETRGAYNAPYYITETEVLPVRHVYRENNETRLLVMEMQPMFAEGDVVPDGLFDQCYNTSEGEKTADEQRYHRKQWKEVIPDILQWPTIAPTVINKAVSQLFLQDGDARPQYITILAGNRVFFLEQEKWFRGAYLEFDLEMLFSEGTVSGDAYTAFYALMCHEALAGGAKQVLIRAIEEEAHKSAYEVTKDLKDGIIYAVEALANEAVYYQTEVLKESDMTLSAQFSDTIKDEALTLVYRLLFIFYAESRDDLDILPSKSGVYEHGYSLEMLRDMEQTPLQSNGAQNGYFFDDSLKLLFGLLSSGYREEERFQDNLSFEVRSIDSPLFDEKRLQIFANTRIRNLVWQQIICRLSLSKQEGKRKRGRISYANLGINQLGSVYESLLSYRGFYATEDLMEVYKPGKQEEGTFLVPYARRDDFSEDEIVKDENGKDALLRRGSFVYRLNGRDRTKSASYYTPESLTRATVKYTLKGYADRIAAGEMRPIELLNLKMLEPAMGAAAFHNEMINQLAELYLTTQQAYKKKRIDPDKYREELQCVKAYLATNNVYGVDINPTAIELGKLSLWLNVIHKDMETPFFGNRLCVGNAVVGAWLKVYNEKEVVGLQPRGGNVNQTKKLQPNAWWDKAPRPVAFGKKKVRRNKADIYHFLLPDKQMLAVLGVKELKAQNEATAKGFATLRKAWIEPITKTDFARLQRISDRIDALLYDYLTQQLNLQHLTQNAHKVWGAEQLGGERTERIFDSYDAKEKLFAIRNNRESAYYKLRTVMDYWCALWYWDFRCGELPPSREEYWGDLEKLLDVDFSEEAGVDVAMQVSGELFPDAILHRQLSWFDTPQQQSVKDAENESDFDEAYQLKSTGETVEVLYEKQTAEDLLAQQHAGATLFDEPGRIKAVQEMARRYRFFHPQLEFLEVFWIRGGFDVICGNPPWLKLEYKEQDIISEQFPEVAIRSVSAPMVRKMREQLIQDPFLRGLIESEQIESEATRTFLNAFVNYPLLVGQQTNLYKCILSNGFSLLSPNGFMGLVHPEGIYDDANGQPLRREVYPRLRYHFQFKNELMLFAEVDHHVIYGIQIYGGYRKSINISSIHNLFHPATIDACFGHLGLEACEGYKRYDEVIGKYVWNLNGHRDRIVHFDEHALQTLAKTFEEGADWQSAKLVSIHAEPILRVLEKLADFKTSVAKYIPIITVGIDETNGVNNGIMRRETKYPDFNAYEMIYSGPHIFVGNPLYKTPRQSCVLNSDYDIIDPMLSDANTEARTNYVPACELEEYRNYIAGFDDSEPWIDTYKIGFRKMLSQAGERTLSGAILPPHASHIHGVISSTFKKIQHVIELTGLTSSIILDFFMKTIGTANLTESRLAAFPLGLEERFLPALFVRTLRLNCVNTHYAALWSEAWNSSYCNEEWASSDSRLASFASLHSEWDADVPLRNWYERRWALIETDVIVAQALGLTLDELCLVYDMQFPVLQQNEMDTWYDAKGQIVFTCSKGLSGIGLDRPVWNRVRQEAKAALKAGENYTYEHVIEKSELYKGHKQTFVAPFDKCDRKADYHRVWPHFAKRFNLK